MGLASLSLSPPAFSQGQEEGPAGRTWAVGLHANFPFLGISFRYWLNDTVGVEINLAPIPRCEYAPAPPSGPEPGEEPPPPDELQAR